MLWLYSRGDGAASDQKQGDSAAHVVLPLMRLSGVEAKIDWVTKKDQAVLNIVNFDANPMAGAVGLPIGMEVLIGRGYGKRRKIR